MDVSSLMVRSQKEWNSTAHYDPIIFYQGLKIQADGKNIPICKPSLMTYPVEAMSGNVSLVEENDRKMAE